MPTPVCECCRLDGDEIRRRHGIDPRPLFVRARGGRMVLCGSCWAGIRYQPAGFVSPDPAVRAATARYRELGRRP